MKSRTGWLSKILPSPSADIKKGADLARGYKKFSRGLSVTLTIIVLIPLAIISIFSHYQVRQLLQEEELEQLLLNLEGSTDTIEKFVSELHSVIKFVARDDRYEELLNPQELEALFVRLQGEYPDFADIEIIDSKGRQKSYVGPYQLAGHNYTDQTWYQEVLLQGVYISNVFSGFRHVPHFVIAMSRKHPNQEGSWVLRVTIDAETLQHFVDTIHTTYADDIFLVDSKFFPQTKPHKYGEMGKKCYLCDIEDATKANFKKRVEKHNTTPGKASRTTVVQKSFEKKHIIQATVEMENTPWKLVMVKEQYLHGTTWGIFKIRLIAFFLSCITIAFLIILEISESLTEHIHESDRKRQQFLTEAENANKLASVGRLAAGVAHEINNPLSIINQKTGLVQDFMEMTGDFDHKGLMEEALEGIQYSIGRCRTITHRLLGFARQTDVSTEEIDINILLREVIDFLAKEATYNQIKIDFDLIQDIKTIFSDRGQLQQIFLNITNNAIDAIGSNGQITLGSRQVDQETIQVRIIDNGPGMSEKVKQHIFDPFFTTKETGKGTGLGLSITYGIIKKLGGSINVISEIGSGTTFEINLPVRQIK